MSYPDLPAALRSLLLSTPEITELVGQRIHSDNLPETVKPMALAYWVISGTGRGTLGNDGTDMPGLVGMDSWRFQFNCYGNNRSESCQLHSALIVALVGFRGIVDSCFIKAISQAEGPRFLTNWQEAGTDYHRPVITQDFFINFNSLTLEA